MARTRFRKIDTGRESAIDAIPEQQGSIGQSGLHLAGDGLWGLPDMKSQTSIHGIRLAADNEDGCAATGLGAVRHGIRHYDPHRPRSMRAEPKASGVVSTQPPTAAFG